MCTPLTPISCCDLRRTEIQKGVGYISATVIPFQMTPEKTELSNTIQEITVFKAVILNSTASIVFK